MIFSLMEVYVLSSPTFLIHILNAIIYWKLIFKILNYLVQFNFDNHQKNLIQHLNW